MAIKLLISGESNSGKTSLTKDLKDTLVISYDGKKYPFPVPHVLVPQFDSTAQLVATINDKIVAYKEKFKVYPKTIVIDTVSKIFDTLLDACRTKHTGFKVYDALNAEITAFTAYLQNTLIASDMNVIIISHAIWDQDTAKYNLVGKGDFGKRGSFLSEVDEAIFIETKNGKRIIHFKATKFPARTLTEGVPDSMPVEEFNLQDYMKLLSAGADAADEFAL